MRSRVSVALFLPAVLLASPAFGQGVQKMSVGINNARLLKTDLAAAVASTENQRCDPFLFNNPVREWTNQANQADKANRAAELLECLRRSQIAAASAAIRRHRLALS